MAHAEPAKIYGMAQDRTGAPIFIDIVHHTIHAGGHYTVTNSGSKDASGSLDLMLVTPPANLGEIHLECATSASNAGQYFLYEGVTTSNDGTAVTINNNKRTSLNQSACKAYHTPTVTATGTNLETHQVGASSGATRVGGTTESRNEYILKPETKYLLRYTATNNTTLISHTMAYYEVI
jgi:hypothetical protein